MRRMLWERPIIAYTNQLSTDHDGCHITLEGSTAVPGGRTGASVTMASILVIDDEAPIRSLLRTTLEAAGHTVTEAANGREGLALYRHQPTDLVITDIAMPELNGLDMMLALTSQFLDAKVIAISGVGGETDGLVVAKLLGARRTFHKPFSMPQLLDAVRYELAH